MDGADTYANVNEALDAVEMINNLSIASIFTSQKIQVSDEYRALPQTLMNRANKIIKEHFESWLDQSVYCKSVDQMGSFEKFYKRTADRLSRCGYSDYGRRIITKGEKELRNKAEIKSRQELIEDGRRFINECEHLNKNNYLEVKRLHKDGMELNLRFEKYAGGLGKAAIEIGQKVLGISDKLDAHKRKMEENMSSIFDIIADANSVDSLDSAIESLETVLRYTLADNDRSEFLELNSIIESLQVDIKDIESCVNNRKRLAEVTEQYETKYSSDDLDYDFLPIINDCIKNTEWCMNQKDAEWRKKNLFLGNKTRQDVYEWKDRIRVLPGYLSESTKADIELLDRTAEKLLSDGKIEDVLQYFKKLSADEKKKCLQILQAEYSR